MEIFWLVVRSFMIVFAVILSAFYVGGQLWQKLPPLKLQVKPHDYFIGIAVSLLMALGVQEYWGLFAFVPLMIVKYLSSKFISKSRVLGSGRWMEIKWQKFPLRGFQLPQEASKFLGQLPGDTHLLVPRLYSNIALRFLMRSVKKNSNKVPVPYKGQEQAAMEMFEGFATRISKLEGGKTEKLSLPFGELKVTRL
jgi:hypothetical protein